MMGKSKELIVIIIIEENNMLNKIVSYKIGIHISIASL